MSDESYNGWSNRETWLVNLHLTNDYDTYKDVQGLVEGAQKDVELVTKLIAGYVGGPNTCLLPVLLRDMRIHDQDWANINWREIAENWIAD